MPLLNFYGKYDHLVPPEACEPLVHHVGSKDITDVCLKTGHIGIYVSSKCQKEFAPKIASWLKERDTTPKKKRAPLKKTTSAKASARSNKRAVEKITIIKNDKKSAGPKRSRANAASSSTNGQGTPITR
jgi:polyhydroxyalkanoate synthase